MNQMHEDNVAQLVAMSAAANSVEQSLAKAVLCLARWAVADEPQKELSDLWLAELWALSGMGRDVGFGEQQDAADLWWALYFLAAAGLSLTAPDGRLIEKALGRVGWQSYALQAVQKIRKLRDAQRATNSGGVIVEEEEQS